MTSTQATAATGLPVDAWIKAIGLPGAVVRSVLRSLDGLGVQLRPRDDHLRPPCNGVVAFPRMGADVADFIREVSRESGRILALSVSNGLPGDDSWDLLRAGASDVFTWRDPTDSARHVAARLRRWRTIDDLVSCEQVRGNLIGDSAVWQAVLRDAVEVALFTDASVLVTGESGTGKERVAQLIHELDPGPNKGNLVVLDCSTVVPSLSGSEFFGHEKGAFTGASAARAGAFELANGGTLFLDEVGELPGTLQAELLRAIQEGTFKRIGSNAWRKSTFRLVCATNREVGTARHHGTFRDDFYYRIAECTLHLPSLRDRVDDILTLFHHFFGQVHPECEPPELEDGVRELLVGRAYPGNVRDLRSLVLRIAHRHLGDGLITVGDIPEEERPSARPVFDDRPDHRVDEVVARSLAQGVGLDELTARVTGAAMRCALSDAAGDVQQAAHQLDVPVAIVEKWQRR